MSGTQFDKIATRYEYWEVLSLPSAYFNREFPYIFVPKTSFVGCFGVPRWQKTAGNKEKRGENDKEFEKEETTDATKTATILWRFMLAILDYKTGDFLRFWPFLCPPIEVTAIFVYCFSCRCVVELGL